MQKLYQLLVQFQVVVKQAQQFLLQMPTSLQIQRLPRVVEELFQ